MTTLVVDRLIVNKKKSIARVHSMKSDNLFIDFTITSCISVFLDWPCLNVQNASVCKSTELWIGVCSAGY